MESDWDVGMLATPDAAPDLTAIGSALVEIVGTERVDVSDLRTACALQRLPAARDGFVLLERDPGTVLAFRAEAVRFRCDAGPLIRAV